jgi:hypothetical protein
MITLVVDLDAPIPTLVSGADYVRYLGLTPSSANAQDSPSTRIQQPNASAMALFGAMRCNPRD